MHAVVFVILAYLSWRMMHRCGEHDKQSVVEGVQRRNRRHRGRRR